MSHKPTRSPSPRTATAHARMAAIIALLLNEPGASIPDMLDALASEGLHTTPQTLHDMLNALEHAGLSVIGRRAAKRSPLTPLRLAIPDTAPRARLVQVDFRTDIDLIAVYQRLCDVRGVSLLTSAPGVATYRFSGTDPEFQAFVTLVTGIAGHVTFLGAPDPPAAG